MSSFDVRFGIPADSLTEWWDGFASIPVPNCGARFVHIRCRHAALWATAVLLSSLARINTRVSNRYGQPRSLVYVLPNTASVEVAKAFLDGHGDLGFGETLRVMTHTDLYGELETAPLPAFLHSAIVVFDTNFGRVSASLLASSARLLSVWEQLAADNVPHRCVAVAVSPSSKHLWRAVNVTLYIEPKPKVLPVDYISDSGTPVGSMVEAVVSLAEEEKLVTVVSCVPRRQALQIRRALEDCSERADLEVLAPLKPFVLTAANFAAEWAAVSAVTAPALVVLLVDPALRFLPPISGTCCHVQPAVQQDLALDPNVLHVVEAERPLHLDDACFVVGMGQDKMTVSGTLTVALCPHDRQLGRKFPKAPSMRSEWPAWQVELPETLLGLVAQQPSSGGALDTLPILAPKATEWEWLRETLRRLHMMQFLEPKPLAADSLLTMQEQHLGLCGRRAQCAAAFLRKGAATTFPEALLFAEISTGTSTAVKMTLAAVASVARVGVANVVEHGTDSTESTSPDREGLCTGPGAQQRRKGRLWLAIGILASIIGSPDVSNSKQRGELPVLGSYCTECLSQFRLILDQTAPDAAAAPFPASLSDAEATAVDVGITRAWLQHLTFVNGPDNLVQFMIQRKVRRVARGSSGDDLWLTDPDCRFAVHFGLARDSLGYKTDSLTLVSSEAVLRVLNDLFPTPPGGGTPDYMALLRDSHRW